ncbi:MAG: hypothetical protein U0804_14025 [Gemmataceae bacterium]
MISRTLLHMDNRYPTAKERSDLQSYLATTRARRSALEEVRRSAVRVTDDLMADIRRMYPQFGKIRPQGFDKGHRDMVMLTHMTANAMFLGETDTTDDMFTHWYKTMLRGVHLTPQFLADTFAQWLASLERNLSPDTFALMRPFAEHMAAALTDVPVPAKDEVGERKALV